MTNQDITFTYSALNQLVETKRGPPESETVLGLYDYNASGLRVRHRLSERGDVDYYYDDRAVIEEHNATDDTLLAHYRYADRLISLDMDEARQYYHHDALGSTVNLTTDSAAVQVSYKLDPWGHLRDQVGASVNRQIFTGQEHDENTGLIYFGARYYDPDTARFITQDSYLGRNNTPPSLHRYLYAYSNPLFFVDLHGYEVSSFLEGGNIASHTTKQVAKGTTRITATIIVEKSAEGMAKKSLLGTMVGGGARLLGAPTLAVSIVLTPSNKTGDPCDFGERCSPVNLPGPLPESESVPIEFPGRANSQNSPVNAPGPLSNNNGNPVQLPGIGNNIEIDLLAPNQSSSPDQQPLQLGTNKQQNSKPPRGTIEGDQWRYDRYKEKGGTLSYDDWYPKSRGGRSGGPDHQAIQNNLKEQGFRTEVIIGDRIVDGANSSEIHQIGGLNKRGDPIARERYAIEDVLASDEYNGQDIYYWDKTDPSKEPIKNPQENPNWGGYR